MASSGPSSARRPSLTNCSLLVHFLVLSFALQVHSNGFNAPPIFNMPRLFNVNENLAIGSHIFAPQVEDDGVAKLQYSIGKSNFKDGSGYFQIDPRSGTVALKKSLVGKGGTELYFYFVAMDEGLPTKIEICIKVIASDNSVKKQRPSTSNSTLSLPSATTSTTRRPERPSPDPLNNPGRNATLSAEPSSPSIDDTKSSGNSLDETGSWQLLYIIPVVIFFFMAILFVFVCHRKVPTRKAIKTISHKMVNNNKSDSTDTTTSTSSFSETDYNGAFFLAGSRKASKEISNSSTISDKGSFLKICENEWEVPRHHLKFIHILGEGCFGQVWKCEAVNIGSNGGSQVVAVKTLKQNASQKEKNDLLEELEVMKRREPHPNVVTLIGCCAEQDPVLLLMEFIPNGTLQNYLRESRPDYGGPMTHCNSSRLTSRDLISFAYQIAKGMEYLSSKGVIHRDLAARNVLVGYNKVCKIADFGFAKYDQIYERKSEGRLPIRWMAVESLTDSLFTSKSDVWSFGILMWEVVTLGWTPYPGFAAAEVIKKVCDGYRLEKPEHCKREMFNIMYYCWDKDPKNRPSFAELVSLLDNILYSENDYIELDRFPDHAYYNIIKNVPGITGEKL